MTKNAYFTPESLASTTLALYQEIENDLHRRDFLRNFQHASLLILDMQDYFLNPTSHAFVPSAPAILPGIQALIQAFSQRGLPIIFTQHLNTPQNAGRMATWWRDLITNKHPLSGIIPELDTRLGTVLIKSQYDAFYQTSLDDILRREGVTQVVICGVMTHLCCETSARSAFMRGFEVFFPIDGTATYNRDFHLATLRNLAHGFATMTTVSELLIKLEASHAI